jgi:ppGpp synthetase/RelA/SpoT-type nucleotidyltranferase
MKQRMQQALQVQVKEMCDKFTEEHFQEVQSLKERLKDSERERERLSKEVKEMQSRVKRQEEYIAKMNKEK